MVSEINMFCLIFDTARRLRSRLMYTLVMRAMPRIPNRIYPTVVGNDVKFHIHTYLDRPHIRLLRRSHTSLQHTYSLVRHDYSSSGLVTWSIDNDNFVKIL